MTIEGRESLPLHGKKILCVVDYESKSRSQYISYLSALLRNYSDSGAEISLIHVDGSWETLPKDLRDASFKFIEVSSVESTDPEIRIRAFASETLKIFNSGSFTNILTFGNGISRTLAGEKTLKKYLWAFIDDMPLSFSDEYWNDRKSLDALYQGSRKVFVSSDHVRGLIETALSSACGRTYLVPVFPLFAHAATRVDSLCAPKGMLLPGKICGYEFFVGLGGYGEELKNLSWKIPVYFDGSKEDWISFQKDPHTALNSAIPNMNFIQSVEDLPHDLSLLGVQAPQEVNHWQAQLVLNRFNSLCDVCVSFDDFKSFLADTNSNDIDTLKTALISDKCGQLEQVRSADSLLVANNLHSENARPTRVVIAGADFKFAGDIVETLYNAESIELRVDRWANNANPQPTASKPFLEWAEVIVCEFSAFNAIWYSQNIKPGQKLIVHLHGYELRAPWISQLNLDTTSVVVFASEFYRDIAVNEYGWPKEKTTVIPNAIDFGDMARPKMPGSEFHLGLVGYTPILKRPDRALDLLDKLLEVDDRFVLHMKGYEPFRYNWEWKKGAHQAAYRRFYERLQDPVLRSRVCFEPFSPDVANWLSRIGWVLSSSTRETFHLAPVEGMASGALPLVWEREGASEIFPADFIKSSTEELANIVLACVSDPCKFQDARNAVQSFAQRYSRASVAGKWLDIIHSNKFPSFSLESISVDTALPPISSEELNQKVEKFSEQPEARSLQELIPALWQTGEYDSALQYLEDNVALTAKASGTLKHWEQWVRGIYQLSLDWQKLSVAGFRGNLYEPDPTCFLAITDSNRDFSKLGVDGIRIERGRVSSFERPHSDCEIETLFEYRPLIRANHNVMLAASAVAVRARSLGASAIIASGGIISVAASFLAARRLGVPFVLLDRDEDTFAEVLRTSASVDISNPQCAVIRKVVMEADLVVTDKDFLPYALNNINCANTSNWVSRLCEKQTNDLNEGAGVNVLYCGTGRLYRGLSAVAHVTVVHPEEIEKMLDNAYDAFIVDYSVNFELSGSQWVSSKEIVKNHSLLTDAFLPARILGTRSIVVTDSDPVHQKDIVSIARRADIVVTNSYDSLQTYFALNPTSNYSGVELSGMPFATVLPKFSGDCGIAEDASSWESKAEALARGDVWMPDLIRENSWGNTANRSYEFPALLFARDKNPSNAIQTAWINLREMAQGRMGIDQAVYILRAAGVAVKHPRGILDNDKLLDLEVEPRLFQAARSYERVTGMHYVSSQKEEDVTYLTFSNNEGESKVPYVDSLERVSGMETEVAFPSGKGISLVMPTYMGADRISRMLDSIARQSIDPELLEVIVIPNGPEDGTADVVHGWSAMHPEIVTVVTEQRPAGVAYARNEGIALATREYISFIDDDDALEENYLLSMYVRASDYTVVLGRLSDEDYESGQLDPDTPTTRRVEELGSRRLPLSYRSGALGMNGGKLLPTKYIKTMHYDPDLNSGEDVAFMAQLLQTKELLVTGAVDFDKSSYIRVTRPNSISRREEDFAFLVSERLSVISRLVDIRAVSPKGNHGAIDYLINNQASFIKKYVERNQSSDALADIRAEAERYGVDYALLPL